MLSQMFPRVVSFACLLSAALAVQEGSQGHHLLRGLAPAVDHGAHNDATLPANTTGLIASAAFLGSNVTVGAAGLQGGAEFPTPR